MLMIFRMANVDLRPTTAGRLLRSHAFLIAVPKPCVVLTPPEELSNVGSIFAAHIMVGVA